MSISDIPKLLIFAAALILPGLGLSDSTHNSYQFPFSFSIKNVLPKEDPGEQKFLVNYKFFRVREGGEAIVSINQTAKNLDSGFINTTFNFNGEDLNRIFGSENKVWVEVSLSGKILGRIPLGYTPLALRVPYDSKHLFFNRDGYLDLHLPGFTSSENESASNTVESSSGDVTIYKPVRLLNESDRRDGFIIGANNETKVLNITRKSGGVELNLVKIHSRPSFEVLKTEVNHKVSTKSAEVTDSLKLSTNSGSLALNPPSDIQSDIALKFPATIVSGGFLVVDADGNLSWKLPWEYYASKLQVKNTHL